ncbi:hypothetical protein [Serratia oryzae]|uniref:DUF1795 domain-containing protein n=1 Tax=Serratia oryzae TaxID=2034155 RepID=A0A1S8CQM5_9GAMM|nr:hypothetical protein [Serratia oryzae]OMQ26933.1 hypothetical protein BMI79_00975 [Serratia oryzae]
MPTTFSEMGKDVMKVKYPANNRPTQVYTNADTTVNFAFNYTANKIAENQLDAFSQQMKAMLANFSPKISKVDVNGQKAVMFDFITPAADTEIHNLMLAMSVDGRLLLTTFNTTKEEAAQWLEVGRESLLSVTYTQNNSSCLWRQLSDKSVFDRFERCLQRPRRGEAQYGPSHAANTQAT